MLFLWAQLMVLSSMAIHGKFSLQPADGHGFPMGLPSFLPHTTTISDLPQLPVVPEGTCKPNLPAANVLLLRKSA